MKKITLIACAALVAGLLVSCNNATEAGTIDYDSVRETKNANNYLVAGTVTTKNYSESGEYDADNKQTDGNKSINSESIRVKSASAVVSYITDSVNETNYQEYKLTFDDAPEGWSSDSSENYSWESTKWGEPTKDKYDEPDDPDAVKAQGVAGKEIEAVPNALRFRNIPFGVDGKVTNTYKDGGTLCSGFPTRKAVLGTTTA